MDLFTADLSDGIRSLLFNNARSQQDFLEAIADAHTDLGIYAGTGKQYFVLAVDHFCSIFFLAWRYIPHVR